MGFLETSTRQLFITDPEGQRVACLGGPFSRPYVIPDEETEHRLSQKLVRLHRIYFWLLVGGSMIATAFVRGELRMAAAIFVVGLLAAAVAKLSMQSEIKKLTRAATRVPIHVYFASVARHQTWPNVWAGFVFAAVFIVLFASMLDGDKLLFGSVGLVMFVPLLVANAFIVKLKWEME